MSNGEGRRLEAHCDSLLERNCDGNICLPEFIEVAIPQHATPARD
jgi:hypothetical protein